MLAQQPARLLRGGVVGVARFQRGQHLEGHVGPAHALQQRPRRQLVGLGHAGVALEAAVEPAQQGQRQRCVTHAPGRAGQGQGVVSLGQHKLCVLCAAGLANAQCLGVLPQAQQQWDKALRMVQQAGRLVRQRQNAVVAPLGGQLVMAGALVFVGNAQGAFQVAFGHLLRHQGVGGVVFNLLRRAPVWRLCVDTSPWQQVNAKGLMVLVHHIAQQAAHHPAEINEHPVDQGQQQPLGKNRRQQRHGQDRALAEQEQEKAQQHIGPADHLHRSPGVGRVQRGAQAARLHQHHEAGWQQETDGQQRQLPQHGLHTAQPASGHGLQHQQGEQLPGQVLPVFVVVAGEVFRTVNAARTQRGDLEAIA